MISTPMGGAGMNGARAVGGTAVHEGDKRGKQAGLVLLLREETVPLHSEGTQGGAE